MNARRRFLAASLDRRLAAVRCRRSPLRREVRGSGRATTRAARASATFDRLSRRRRLRRSSCARAASEAIELDRRRRPAAAGRDRGRGPGRLAHPADRAAGATPTRRAAPADRRDPHRLVRLSGIALAGGSRQIGAAALQGGQARRSRSAAPATIALAALEAERLAVTIGGSGAVARRRPQRRGRAHHRRQRPLRCSPTWPPTTSRSASPAAATPTSAPSADCSASIAGTGDVRHSGAAMPTVSIVGSGDVQRL